MSMHEELSGSEQIEMSVVQQRLLTVADDVGHILIRGAFSSNIKERRDCSTAVFEPLAIWSHRQTTCQSILGHYYGECVHY